jgi:hypothetical protein
VSHPGARISLPGAQGSLQPPESSSVAVADFADAIADVARRRRLAVAVSPLPLSMTSP